MASTRNSEAVVMPFQQPEATPRLDTPLLTPAQAAELLAVRPSWIYEAVRTGSLPCLRIGRHIRFTKPMLEEWLRGRCA